MKIEKSQKSANGGGNGSFLPHVSVRAEDYVRLAIEAVRANGGRGFVVYGPREAGHDPQKWRAWMAYFAHLRPSLERTWSTLSQITTPTDWPADFDLSAPAAPMVRDRPKESVSTQRRAELAAILRRVSAVGLAEGLKPAHEDQRGGR